MTKELGRPPVRGVAAGRWRDECSCETHAERMVVRRWRQNVRKPTHRIRLQRNYPGERLRAIRARQTFEALKANWIISTNVKAIGWSR